MPRDPIEPGGGISSNEVAISVCIERGSFDITQNCTFYDSNENQLTAASAESPFTAKLTLNSFPQTVIIEYQEERMSYTFNNGGVGYLIRFYGNDVSEVETPDRVAHKIKDSRIPGVDNAPTSGSENVVTSGGIYTALQNAALSLSEIRDIWNDVFGATLISFTINGTTYQAEEGMTWMEWTESEYNTGEYVCSGQNVTAPVFGAPIVHDVNATDVIVDGRAYTHNTFGGGGND